MGNCDSSEYSICNSCGKDVDDKGFVQVEHSDFCSMDLTIQDLIKKLNQSRSINSSIVRKGQNVLACSDTAQRRIKLLENKITALNSDINSLTKQLNSAKQQNNTDLTKLQFLSQKLNDAKIENSSLKSQNSSLKELVQKDTTAMPVNWRPNWPVAAQKRIQNLEAEIAELRSENTSLKTISPIFTPAPIYTIPQRQRKSHKINNENLLYIKDLEDKIAEYQRIINENDNQLENSCNSNRICSLCFDEYTNDRQQVALSPCGHSPVCINCFGNEECHQKCPICNTKARFSN